jgi:hypothetical protein
MAAADKVVRGEVGGIPFFSAEGPGPLWAGLGQDLKLSVDSELITFTDVQPKGKATELAKGLEGPVAAPAS